MAYLVIDRKTLVTFRADTVEAADHIASTDALSPEAIAWAIEEYGRCDGNDYTIIPEEWKEE
jgi:hypothetical protein